MCAFIAQLVEHRTGITEVTGSNPGEALIFFRLLSNCSSWQIYCNDHSSLSASTLFEFTAEADAARKGLEENHFNRRMGPL